MSENNGSTNGKPRQEVIARDNAGRALRIRANGHVVELSRLDHSDLILLSCYDAKGQPCEVNARGICPHALEGLFLAASDAGVCVTTTSREDAARELAEQVGGKILLARSGQTPHGEGRLWVIAGANGTPRDPDTVAREAGATHKDARQPLTYWRVNGHGVEIGTVEAGRLTWQPSHLYRVPESAGALR